jgi:PhzF family phenazine biosynthesis protein
MKLDLVDVFASDNPLTGNPLAVVHHGDALSTQQMERLTRWLGFSETTFLLPPTEPGADYHVRIFCPRGSCPLLATPRWARHGPGSTLAGSPSARAW